MFSNHYSTSDLFLAIFCIAYILGLFHKSWLKSVFWDNFPYLLTLQGALLIVCKELLSLWYARSSFSFNSMQGALLIVCKELLSLWCARSSTLWCATTTLQAKVTFLKFSLRPPQMATTVADAVVATIILMAGFMLWSD